MKTALVSLAFVAIVALAACGRGEVVVEGARGPRVTYGVEKLEAAGPAGRVTVKVVAGSGQGAEGFRIEGSGKDVRVEGADASGAMYGCLELARRVKEGKGELGDLHLAEAPVMRLRGACIGMQKPNILPGRKVYEYPYTPVLFPWFYDKALWTEYLDFLAANRFNTLYLWNGHPFASLVRVKEYPYAVEVDDATFARNQEMFRWIAAEADRRGIWVVQMFYSILVSKPFAEHQGISTQMGKAPPVVDDYTRKSVAEFIRAYPNVGLMVCLGEACTDLKEQTRWLSEVILPGVKDGMAAAGLKEEPPVVVRTHATDLRVVMPVALKVYKNLYTSAKFNGESLTTWAPRGKWQQVHLDMSRLGSTHIMNVHILANLEPFRYGATEFIRKCVLAGRDRLGARGLHLYPLCYWNWPESADEPPEKQWERDWIWFEAWGRYAWNPDREAAADRAYWVGRLKDVYGADDGAAGKILDAYNDMGECAPRLIRRFGITEGNRQTLSLGMTLDELVNPKKYGENKDLWESDAPPGERLNTYVEREWKKEPHEGETPVSIDEEVLAYSGKAVAEIEGARAGVTKNVEEFGRVANDAKCVRAMSQNYVSKVRAAMGVLRYGYSHDVADMVGAEKDLAESLGHFEELARLTEGTYRFANSMQTRQRKIPVPGGTNPGADGERRPAFYHWSQMVPVYEKELAEFREKVEGLKEGGGK